VVGNRIMSSGRRANPGMKEVSSVRSGIGNLHLPPMRTRIARSLGRSCGRGGLRARSGWGGRGSHGRAALRSGGGVSLARAGFMVAGGGIAGRRRACWSIAGRGLPRIGDRSVLGREVSARLGRGGRSRIVGVGVESAEAFGMAAFQAPGAMAFVGAAEFFGLGGIGARFGAMPRSLV
jgi:hypothetical protein